MSSPNASVRVKPGSTAWRHTEPHLPLGDGTLAAYTDEFGACPGGRLSVHVTSAVGDYDAEIVGLYHASLAGVWSGATPAGVVPLGRHRGEDQLAPNGSSSTFAARPVADLGGCRFEVWTWPTLPLAGHEQTIADWRGQAGGHGIWIGLDAAGHLLARVGCSDGVVALRGPLALEREWLRVVVDVGAAKAGVTMSWSAPARWTNAAGAVEAERVGRAAALGESVTFGASPTGEACFNGKVARPRLLAGEGGVPLQEWHLHEPGQGVRRNSPALAVTGPDWNGAEVDPRLAPQSYDAIHYHEDDLDDAGWQPAFEIEVPRDCPSGVYGLRLTGTDAQDVVPFVVSPAPDGPAAPVALWLPTLTYLAYANQRRGPGETDAFTTHSLLDEEVVPLSDRVLDARPDFGLSLYDRHRDGSPCRYSSWRRPIVNLRPGDPYRHTGRPRSFSGDLRFLRWLSAKVGHVDVITDEAVHRDGVAALQRHRVVITGSHPEYVTGAMLDAVEAYPRRGGRLMYLGGNGYYWVTGIDEQAPHIIEVRRGHGGVNPTGDAPPGENHLSTTGELGGVWRIRGRAPQRAVGVGMAGMGWGPSSGYSWTPDSADPTVAFISEGVDRTQPLGAGTEEYPWGAPFDEIDCADVALGTPRNAKLIATSLGSHDERMGASVADIGTRAPCADVVYVEADGGGRVFTVGAMGWTDAFEACPDVARVTANVLEGFLSGG